MSRKTSAAEPVSHTHSQSDGAADTDEKRRAEFTPGPGLVTLLRADFEMTSRGPELLPFKIRQNQEDAYELAVATAVYNHLIAARDASGTTNHALGDPDTVADRMLAALPHADFWDEKVGPFYDTAGLTDWLHVTRQTLHNRMKTGKVLGVKTADGELLYPAFQFSADGEPLPHLPKILALLEPISDDSWDKALWLNTASDRFDGHTGAEALRSDAAELVFAAAERDSRILAS